MFFHVMFLLYPKTCISYVAVYAFIDLKIDGLILSISE